MRKIILAVIAIGCTVFHSCEDTFEKDITKSEVKVVLPVDKAEVLAGEVSFLWEKMGGATAFHVTIVSPSFEMASTLVADSVVAYDPGKSNQLMKIKMKAGEYEWRIRGVNQAYKTDFTTRSLSVKEEAVEVP